MTLDHFFREFGTNLADGVSLPGLGVTFVAGIVASAVCPCTLPVGLGMASAAAAAEAVEKRRGLKIAGTFFAGIVINLTLLGLLSGHLGALLTENFGTYWALLMAIISVVAAALAFWGPRLEVNQLARMRRRGAGGAFVYGFIFSLGTSVAPLLLLLTVSAAQASPLHGLALAFAFGLGRGLPFLITGVVASAVTRFTRLARWRRPIQIISGCALLLVSAYYTYTFTSLA